MTTARRAYENNPRLTSFEIGQAIGRSRQAVDAYIIADLRASTELEMDLKIFRMHRINIPQERIAKRLGAIQRTVSKNLEKMPALAIILNTDLSKGSTVPQVAEKHACPVGPEDRTGVQLYFSVYSIGVKFTPVTAERISLGSYIL